MKRNRLPLVLLFSLVGGIALLLSGCATATPGVTPALTPSQQVLLETQKAINAVGVQFAQTYDLYNALYAGGKMEEATYRKFVNWASDFQVAYALAYQTFKDSKDSASASDALDRVLKLKDQLVIYYLGAGGKL